MSAATFDLSSKVRVLLRKSFICAGAVLEGQLNVVETGCLERRDARLIEPDSRGDQIGVEAQRMASATMVSKIVAHQRLAARKPQLHRAQRARLAQHAQPVIGGEFGAGAREIRRVVAEHAVQRTAVGQLEQQPQRRPRSQLGPRRARLSTNWGAFTDESPATAYRRAMATKASTSFGQSGGGEGPFKIRGDVGHSALAVAALHDLAGAAVEFDHAFRVEQNVRVCAGSHCSRMTPGDEPGVRW